MGSHSRGLNTEHTLTGLNHSLHYRGKEIHIQTEDLGDRVRLIATQVFCEGRVVLSTRVEYPPAARGQDDRQRLAELMRKQHFCVIRELEARFAP